MEIVENILTRRWIELGRGHLVLLGLLGLLAFFYNLPISLFGAMEGMYAEITEIMISSGEYVHLVHQSAPYYSKPPLFFWLQALSRSLLGWNEAALRLPSVLSSFGTMVLTYSLGTILFSRTAGFWAALVVATSYVSVWFGAMGIIDPILTFCMTLGLWGFVRAYLRQESQWWYVLGFVALALGAMVKTLHAFVMPMVLFLVILWVLRDGKPLKTPLFWVGVSLFGILVGSYYALLGPEFSQHFFFEENLKRLTMVAGDTRGSALEAYFGSRPLPWYAAIIWFDFFPWSAFIPSCFLLLWKKRPLHQFPREALVLIWVIGYFVAFSLVPEKHERYLMPLIPGMALMVGYFYHRVWYSEELRGREAVVLRSMLGILSVAFLGLMLVGPLMIQKKWNMETNVFPVIFQVIIALGAAGLLYLVVRSQIGAALSLLGGLAVGFLIAVVVFIVPGINAVASPKLLLTEVRAALRHPDDPIRTFQHWHWRHDEDQYYWRAVHKYDRILAENLGDQEAMEVLKEEIHKIGPVVLLVTEKQYNQLLAPDPELDVTVIRKFHRPSVTIHLVSIDFSK